MCTPMFTETFTIAKTQKQLINKCPLMDDGHTHTCAIHIIFNLNQERNPVLEGFWRTVCKVK